MQCISCTQEPRKSQNQAEAMEERKWRSTSSWPPMLPVIMMAMAILAVSFNGAAAQPPPDTNVLCVSKCGTCPTVCSSPPPPASGNYNPVLSPPKGTGSGSVGGSSSSPSAPLAKGGQPGGSNYYYFFTSGGSSHGCAAALLLPPLVSLAVAALSQ
nr:uncharacterized protein LOC9270085 [Oryza sativa Japonica Group]